MQTPPRLQLDGWSDSIKLYPEISELPLPDAVLQLRYVAKMQAILNSKIEEENLVKLHCCLNSNDIQNIDVRVISGS